MLPDPTGELTSALSDPLADLMGLILVVWREENGREWKGKGERRGEREEKGNPRVPDWENKKVATIIHRLTVRDHTCMHTLMDSL